MARLRWLSWFVLFIGISSIAVAATAKSKIETSSLPLTFEVNRGQAPAPDRFVMHHDGATALFSKGAIDLALRGSPDHATANVRLRMVNSSMKAVPTGEDRLDGVSNYLLGKNPKNWITHITNYSRVLYSQIYPGISLVYYGSGAYMEHDFIVAPHANPALIRLSITGAKDVRLSPDGNLRLTTTAGVLVLEQPLAYQERDGVREPVKALFHLATDGRVSFSMGIYDTTRTLVIDPVLAFSTYLDGTYSDNVRAVTTDPSGNVYVTGDTGSSDFPLQKAQETQLSCANAAYGCSDAFVTKLDPTGKTLIYSTYLGGSGSDYGRSIAVDSKGDAIVGGVSQSEDFPNAGDIPTISCQINYKCFFVASLSPDGSTLNYAGLVGGSEVIGASATDGRIAVDSSGNAYIAGITDDSSFQITPGTLATTITGYPDSVMFVMKFSPSGSIVYSTVVPGNGTLDPSDPFVNLFSPSGIAVDSSGQVTVAGTAGLGLPVTSGVVGSSFPNSTDNTGPAAGFVLQLNATASAINFASYVPGTDTLGAMAVDGSGNIFVTGGTSETNLPASANAYQSAIVPGPSCTCNSGYIVKLNSSATSVLAATYLGGAAPLGNEGTSFTGIALDSNGNIFVGGATGSSSFPLQNPLISEFEDDSTAWEMVLAEVDSKLSTLEFGSYLSGTALINGVLPGSTFDALTVDSNNDLIVGGTTDISDFPTTQGSLEPTPPPSPTPQTGYIHSFISKIDMATAAPSFCPASWQLEAANTNALSTSQQILDVMNCGNTPLNFSSIVSSDPIFSASQDCSPLAPGAVCPVTVTFSPISDAATDATITFSDDAAISSQTISVYGQGMAPSLQAQPDPADLGSLLVGTKGPQTVLTIFNSGNASAVVTSVSISGSEFSIASNACTGSTYQSGACDIDLAFAPTTAGEATGTLTIDSNDPVHPQLVVTLSGMGVAAYPTPVITQTEQQEFTPQSTFEINNGAQTLNIYGSNFLPSSVAEFNGNALATTFESNTEIQATIPVADLDALGEFPLTVVNPSPGGTSAPFTITTYEVLALNPSAIVSVPATGMLYAAIPASAISNPNTVIPIDPTTGTEGTPISVGNNPTRLAASSDGSYLFVALGGDQTVQRIDLTTDTVDQTFPYAPNSSCSGCNVPASTDLETVPGSPTEVVLAQGISVAMYNGSGLVNYVPNAFVATFAPSFDSIAFAGSPLALYAQPFTMIQNPFFTTASITSSGLQYTELTGSTGSGQLPSAEGNEVVSDGKLLYTDSGEVWDPASQTMVGTFAASNPFESSHNLTLDTTAGEIFLLGFTTVPQSQNANPVDNISAFDQSSLATLGTLGFPQVGDPEPSNLVRWGNDGFGFVASAIAAHAGIYLFQSSALTSRTVNPVPSITSATGIDAAAGASMALTIDGTNFVPTSEVNWNGTEVPTTYMSSTQLTAQVSPAELYGVTSAQVTVTNPAPGGGTSAAYSFVVSSIPTVTVQAASSSITTAQSLSVTVAVTGNNGNSTPTGSVVLSSGNYSSSSVALNNGTAVISIPAGLLATGADTLTAAYTPDSTTSSTYDSASGAAPVTVTAIEAFTLSASPGTISVADGSSTVTTITVTPENGFSGSVALSASGLPAGVTALFAAGTVPGTQTLTLTANSSAAVTSSSVTVTVTGTSGTLDASTSVALSVTSEPGFAGSGNPPSSLSVSPGSDTTASIEIGGTNGFTGTVTLSCNVTTSISNVNDLPGCSLNPNMVTISGATDQTSTLTITTTGGSTSSAKNETKGYFGSSAGAVALALMLFFVMPRRRRNWVTMIILLSVIAAVGMLGCGGSSIQNTGGGNPGTTPGAYTVSVTGNSGSQTVTLETVNLTVQ